jgi:hypothetical protein
MVSLLIAISVLFPAIRAFPGNTVAGHAPLVLIHAFLAHGKFAATGPAEHDGLPAAMALPGFF